VQIVSIRKAVMNFLYTSVPLVMVVVMLQYYLRLH